MKTTLVLALMVSLAFVGTIAVAQPAKPFPDVPKDHWAYQAVMELKAKGILIGYPDGSFNGEGTKVVKPVYDISTPDKTFHSLVLAMQSRDEAGVRYALTKECFASDALFYFGDRTLNEPHSKPLKARLDFYQKRAKYWSKLHFVAFETTAGKAEGTFNEYVAGPFGPPLFTIRFEKVNDEWKISRVGDY